MISLKIRKNESWLVGATEMELIGGGLHLQHLSALHVSAKIVDWYWEVSVKVELDDIEEVFPIKVSIDADIPTLALAISHETDNINRWIERYI